MISFYLLAPLTPLSRLILRQFEEQYQRQLWAVEGEEIIRVPIAREPDWTAVNPDDEGLLLEVRGPGVSNVRLVANGVRLFTRAVNSDEVLVAVLGDLETGPLLDVDVADVTDRAAYSATILQVSGPTDALRSNLSGYSANFEPSQTFRNTSVFTSP